MKKLQILFILLSISLIAQNKAKSFLLVPYRDGNLWGFCDTLGVVKVKPFANDIINFSIGNKAKGKYVIKNTSDKISVIDEKKTIILPPTSAYDSIKVSADYEEIAIFKNGKMGIFTNMKELIPPIYDRITLESNYSYEIVKDGMKGLVNSKGQLIIPTEYKYISSSYDKADEGNSKFVWVAESLFSEKKFYDIKISKKKENEDFPSPPMAVQSGVKTTVYNLDEMEDKKDSIKNNLLKIYDEVDMDYRLESAIVKKSGKTGYYDIINNKETIPPIYSTLKELTSEKGISTFLVSINNKFGLIKTGNVVYLSIEYDAINYLYYDTYTIEKDGKKGVFIFNTVYPKIEPKYITIKRLEPIPVNDYWQFGMFEVTTVEGKRGFLGENGVEYFKN